MKENCTEINTVRNRNSGLTEIQLKTQTINLESKHVHC